MSPIAGTELGALTERLDKWFENWVPAKEAGARLETVTRAASGWSSDTLVVAMSASVDLGSGRASASELVVRIAPAPEAASFPEVDLAAQAAVMEAVRRSGLPAPTVVCIEEDARWVGSPFLVMVRVAGRTVGDAPSLDPWLMALPGEDQRRVHEAFVDALAGLHRIDWRAAGLARSLRDSGGDMVTETKWWTDYVDWASDGSPTPSLAAHARWCVQSAPEMRRDRSLCWGDARLGNVMLDDGASTTALLDWELATIGPPEMDFAWYLALERLTTRVTGTSVPGFMDREETIARYERRLGRRLEELDWHEIFALVRSAAINDRQARLAASAGVDYPGVFGEDNPLLAHIGRRIARFKGERSR
ncbi:MAG: phosphotransferase family protein [Acidimicrobiales bacterium]